MLQFSGSDRLFPELTDYRILPIQIDEIIKWIYPIYISPIPLLITLQFFPVAFGKHRHR